MDVKKDSLKKYKKKIKDLKKHNDLYYNQDNPKISDAEYDDLKKELLELEKNNPYFKKHDSV